MLDVPMRFDLFSMEPPDLPPYARVVTTARILILMFRCPRLKEAVGQKTATHGVTQSLVVINGTIQSDVKDAFCSKFSESLCNLNCRPPEDFHLRGTF